MKHSKNSLRQLANREFCFFILWAETFIPFFIFANSHETLVAQFARRIPRLKRHLKHYWSRLLASKLFPQLFSHRHRKGPQHTTINFFTGFLVNLQELHFFQSIWIFRIRYPFTRKEVIFKYWLPFVTSVRSPWRFTINAIGSYKILSV